MKIKNKYVEVKMGNKNYKKENMILDTYLKKIFDMMTDSEHENCIINRCYLKLDTPIENVDYDTELDGLTDFDVFIYSSYVSNITANKKTMKVSYKFDDDRYYYQNKYYSGKGLKILNGRKITAIGFGFNRECLTFLDTNNMNIIINSNEKLIITRVDEIQSNGIATYIDYPLHLVNDTANRDSETKEIDVGGRTIFVTEDTKAELYSIGFGNTEGLMEEEYLINEVETSRNETSITFNLNRTKKVGHYPSEDLHLGFYPTMDNSKYLIFKYRLYRRYFNDFSEQYNITYLDKYYTMSKPNENFGNLEIKLKIERL